MDRTVTVRLVASIGQYQAQLGAASAQTKAFGQDMYKAAAEGNQAMQSLGKGMMVAGGLVAAGLALSVGKAMEFEREMRNVNSITKQSESAFAATSAQVLALSRTVPQSAATLAQGLYDIASSGFQGAEGMEILEKSAIAATAGMTTTDVASKAIVATLNAYGRQARDAGDISDVLFKTVDVGVISFEELAEGMGDWIGMAAAAKVPVDEASAAIAAMTLVGVSAAESGTSLNRVLQSIISPSEELGDQLAELGYESGAQALQTDGLRGVMEKLRTATGGNITELQALFPEVRALRGVLALTANDGQNFGRTFDQITDAQKRAGAAQLAYAEQSKALSVQWDLTKSSMNAFAIEVGNRLLPIMSTLAGAVGGLFDSFSGLPGPVITATTAFAGVTAVALTAGGALLVLAPRIQATSVALLSMGQAGITAHLGLAMLFSTLGKATLLLAVAIAAKAVDDALENMLAGKQDIGALSASLAEFGRTGDLTGEAVKGFGADLDTLVRAVRSTTDLTGWEKFFTAPKLSDTQALKDYDEALTSLVKENRADEAAAAFDRFAQKLASQGISLDRAKEAFPGYSAAQAEATEAAEAAAFAASEEQRMIDQLGVSVGETTLKTKEQTEAQKLLQGVYDDVSSSIMGFTDPMDAYRSALETNTSAAQAEGQAALDRATQIEGANATAGKSWEDYATVASVSLNQVLEELNKQDEAFNNWADNLAKIAARGRGDLAIELAKLGPEAAPLVQAFSDETGAIFNETADAWIRNTRRGQDGSAQEIVQGSLVQQEFARQGANATVETVAAALDMLPPEVQRIVNETAGKLGQVPPIVGATGVAMKDRLWGGLAGFQRVVADYQNALTSGVYTVRLAVEGPGGLSGIGRRKADGGVVEFYAQGGMKEKHQAEIARAGDWRVWAEPETGGEAYIPLAWAKRERSTAILEEVARRFGLSVRDMKELPEGRDYHDGGLYVPPGVPGLPGYGPPQRPAGEGTMANMREFAAEWARRHMDEDHHQIRVSGGNVLARIQSVLGDFPGLRVTSTYRSPARNAAVGGARNSLHMDRDNPAVDVGGPTRQLDKLYAVLKAAGGWRELLWRVKGHFDHLHAAEEGMILNTKSFDQGGWLQPGLTLAHNGTGRPEAVGARPEEYEALVSINDSVSTVQGSLDYGFRLLQGSIDVGFSSVREALNQGFASLRNMGSSGSSRSSARSGGSRPHLPNNAPGAPPPNAAPWWGGRDLNDPFVENAFTDPNANRPGYRQAEDGSWVPASFFSQAEFDRNAMGPNAGKPGYVQAEDGSWVPLSFYDGVKRAHTGGIVGQDWPTLSGIEYDERPAILQVGEKIIPKNETVMPVPQGAMRGGSASGAGGHCQHITVQINGHVYGGEIGLSDLTHEIESRLSLSHIRDYGRH